MSEFRYRAFISYSHRDARWANWLHRALETYRVPRRLRGYEGKHGPVQTRLRPVFKDREDLGAAHSLSEEIAEALEASENLIVICSPNARESRWINEEIRLFRRLGRANHIYCLVVDGQPEATEPPDACFPEALLEADGEERREPLASDVRKWADGRHLAKLKLIAGLLGVPLDLLRRREHQRQVRFRIAAALGAVAALLVLYFSASSWMAAENRRDSGQTLVAIKLNELRSLLGAQQDPEALVRLGEWTPEQLRRLRATAEAESGSLMAHSLALRDQGFESEASDDWRTALSRYRDAWALNALQFQADREDPDVYFELGQAEYYVGSALYALGRWDEAETAFVAYAEITRRLIQSEPENAEWVLEMAYALSNLGILFMEEFGRGSPEKTLQMMQSALEYNQIALVLDPGNRDYRQELGQSKLNLADAQEGVCDLRGALETALEAVAQERKVLRQPGDDSDSRWDLAAALGASSLYRWLIGQETQAVVDIRESLAIFEALADEQADPGQFEYEDMRLWRASRLLYFEGFVDDASYDAERSRELATQWNELLRSAEELGIEALSRYTWSLIYFANLERLAGREDSAVTYLVSAIEQARSILEKAPRNRTSVHQLADADFRYWQLTGERPPGLDESGLDYLRDESGVRSCLGAHAALQLSLVENRPETARRLGRYLTARGYAAPDFVELCNAYSVCE